MARWTMIGLALGCGFGGCSGEDPEDEKKCTTSVLGSYPEDGASEVFYRTVVDATLAREEPDATLEVLDASGSPVPGSVVRSGTRLTFVADAPYTPGETYTSRLEWSCDPITSTFSIATDIGDAVDGAALVDRTWAMDMRQGRFVAPIGIGAILEDLLEAKLLLAVDSSGPEGLQFTAGAADIATDDQDLCSPTSVYDSPADYGADPFFTVHQDSIRLVILGDVLDITDLTFSGAFAPGGDYISGASLDGILDTRDLIESVAPNSDDEYAVCNLFDATFGVECEACPDGSGVFCIQLVIDGLTMPEASYDLLPRSDAEIAADPVCTAE